MIDGQDCAKSAENGAVIFFSKKGLTDLVLWAYKPRHADGLGDWFCWISGLFEGLWFLLYIVDLLRRDTRAAVCCMLSMIDRCDVYSGNYVSNCSTAFGRFCRLDVNIRCDGKFSLILNQT